MVNLKDGDFVRVIGCLANHKCDDNSKVCTFHNNCDVQPHIGELGILISRTGGHQGRTLIRLLHDNVTEISVAINNLAAISPLIALSLCDEIGD